MARLVKLAAEAKIAQLEAASFAVLCRLLCACPNWGECGHRLSLNGLWLRAPLCFVLLKKPNRVPVKKKEPIPVLLLLCYKQRHVMNASNISWLWLEQLDLRGGAS